MVEKSLGTAQNGCGHEERVVCAAVFVFGLLKKPRDVLNP